METPYSYLHKMGLGKMTTHTIEEIIRMTKEGTQTDNVDTSIVYISLFKKLAAADQQYKLSLLPRFGMEFFVKMELNSHKYDPVNGQICDIFALIIKSLNEKLIALEQPEYYTAEEIFVPVVIALHLHAALPHGNMRKCEHNLYELSQLIFNRNVEIKAMASDLSTMSKAIQYSSKLFKYHYVTQNNKAMITIMKLGLEIIKCITPQYMQLEASSNQDNLTYGEDISTFMNTICFIIKNSIQEPSKLPFVVSHKLRLSLMSALNLVQNAMEKLFLYHTLDEFADLYRVIELASDRLELKASAFNSSIHNGIVSNAIATEISSLNDLRNICCDTWLCMIKNDQLIDAINHKLASSANALQMAIGLILILLQTNDKTTDHRCSIAVLENMLVTGDVGRKFEAAIKMPNLMDDFIASAATIVIKFMQDLEHHPMTTILMNGLLSKCFQRAYASYNIFVIIYSHFKRSALSVEYRQWMSLKFDLMSVSENVSHAFVSKLLGQIYEISQIDGKSTIIPEADVEMSEANMDQMNATRVKELKEYISLLVSHDDWLSTFSSQRWYHLLGQIGRSIHSPRLYAQYRGLINNQQHTTHIQRMLEMAQAEKCLPLEAALLPLFICHHIIYLSDDEHAKFVTFFRTNSACCELISYTNTILRENGSRAKNELPNLLLILKLLFNTFKFNYVTNERLIRLQLLSSDIFKDRSDGVKFDVVEPVYITTNAIDPLGIHKSFLLSSSGCNWNKCFNTECDKIAADEFTTFLNRIKLDVNRLKMLLKTRNRGENVNLVSHIDEIRMIRNEVLAMEALARKTSDEVHPPNVSIELDRIVCEMKSHSWRYNDYWRTDNK